MSNKADMKGLAVTLCMCFCERTLLEEENMRNNQNPAFTEMVTDVNSNLLFLGYWKLAFISWSYL